MCLLLIFLVSNFFIVENMKDQDQTEIFDNRRRNLLFLIEQYGTLTKLNVVLGRSKSDATLNQIKNRATNSGTGKARQMGGEIARSIELKLNLPNGWMDQQHTDETLNAFQVKESVNFSKDRDVDNQHAVNAGLFFLDSLRKLGFLNPEEYEKIKNGKLTPYPLRDSSFSSICPSGGILLLDESVTAFSKEGIYLISLENILMLRRVEVDLNKGGLLLTAEKSTPQHVSDISKIKIHGRVEGILTRLSI